MEYTFEDLKAKLALIEAHGDQIADLHLAVNKLSEQIANSTVLAEVVKDQPEELEAPTPEELEAAALAELEAEE